MTTTTADNIAALDEACEIMGGAASLAEALQIAPSLISMWKERGRIPAEYCPGIEAATGISCERLCPADSKGRPVRWDVLRKKRPTKR